MIIFAYVKIKPYEKHGTLYIDHAPRGMGWRVQMSFADMWTKFSERHGFKPGPTKQGKFGTLRWRYYEKSAERGRGSAANSSTEADARDVLEQAKR